MPESSRTYADEASVASEPGPSGVVSFLFTDIEGSTCKWEACEDDMSRDLVLHDRILRERIEARRGYVFKTVGDAFCAAFASPFDAVLAAAETQRALAAATWLSPGGISVRMGLHAGEAERRDADYFGPVLNRAARLQSLAYGGQVIVSLAFAELIMDRMPTGLSLEPLGSFHLKDLARPEAVSQLKGPGLRERFPALKSLDGKPHNLPLQPTPFVDRDAELRALGDALVEGGERLITLIGPGGIGKTRLALQAAAEILESFDGGAWFVDLSECSDADAAGRAVCRCLGVKDDKDADPFKAVASRLEKAGRTLLILDNMEQALAAAAAVGALLSRLPRLSIIATSRAALAIRWEHCMPLSPLAFPEPGADDDLAALCQYQAVRLFIERGKAANPSFRVDEGNAPAIAQICRDLDGIPLAIELAAARIKAFTPEEILVRLRESIDFLDPLRSDLPVHQRTLRAVAQWSYRLLGKAEKELFAALGVFARRFDLEAVERIVLTGVKEADAAKRRRAAALTLASLVEKSLVVREEGPGPARYRLLEMLKAFAREALERSGRAEELYSGHAALYRERAASCMRRLAGVDDDYPEMALAMDRLLERALAEETLAMACSLWQYYDLRGAFAEGIARINAALRASGAAGLRRAEALCRIGLLERSRGRYEEAGKLFNEALALSETAGAAPDRCRDLLALGWNRYYRGDSAGAESRFQEALALAQGAGLKGEEARVKQGLGSLALTAGRLDEAGELLGAAYTAFEEEGEDLAAARAAGNLAILSAISGDRAKARGLFERTLSLFQKLGDRECSMLSMNNLACFELEEGDPAKALEFFMRVEFDSKALAMTWTGAAALAGQADARLALGSPKEAAEAAARGASLAAERGLAAEEGLCRRAYAQALAAMGRREEALAHALRAAELLGTGLDAQELNKAQKIVSELGGA
jgi:predicted ATPase/class 3 adenylate cyclase